MQVISPKTDFAFKELMSNEEVRKQFISDVLRIPLESIQSVQLCTPFLRKARGRQKQGILDVAVVLNDDTKIDIEMQLRIQKYWFRRGQYYLTKMYSDELMAGEHYERLHKCVAIHLLDFDLTEGQEYHSVYTFRDQNGNAPENLLEMHIIEMRKVMKEEGAVADWIRLFSVSDTEELGMIPTKNTGMKEAVEMIKSMSFGRSLKWMYDQHLKAVRDRWAEDEYVRDEGRAEGMRLGIEQGIEQGIERGMRQGMDRGIAKARAEAVEAVMKNLQVSREEAYRILGISQDGYKNTK